VSGRLGPGARLPATRALAVQLGVSRGVVVEAYAQLAAEGYLVTRRGGGTTVGVPPRRDDGRSGTVVRSGAGPASPAATNGFHAAAFPPPGPPRYDLRPALPALAGFPRKVWLAALGRVLNELPDDRLGYADPAGVPELRAALADYLGRVRGIQTEPERIVVTAGVRQGVTLVWSVLAAAGAKRVAVEQPGWRGMRETASTAGLTAVSVPVDRDGIVIDQLDGLAIDAVAVTPAHQFPTGAVLSPSRRTALVAWAQRTDTWIVEDDYDAEFRYDRQPVGALQGLAPEWVLAAGSTSKTLAPAARIGWLVLPWRLAEAVRDRQLAGSRGPSPLEQLALADLIRHGDYDRHLRLRRRAYRLQRDTLLTALTEALPDLPIEGIAAGLHVVLRLPAGTDESAVLAAANESGVALEGLGDERPALVLGYANLSEAAVFPAITALAAAIKTAG
jgi:GntR family transcriptional regulator/MocR family aminotransferase